MEKMIDTNEEYERRIENMLDAKLKDYSTFTEKVIKAIEDKEQ